MKKFLDLKDGDQITNEEWDLIQKEMSMLFANNIANFSWHQSEQTKPISTVQIGKVNGADNYPNKLEITVKNSKATMKKHLRAVERAKNCGCIIGCKKCQGKEY